MEGDFSAFTTEQGEWVDRWEAATGLLFYRSHEGFQDCVNYNTQSAQLAAVKAKELAAEAPDH